MYILFVLLGGSACNQNKNGQIKFLYLTIQYFSLLLS